MRRTFKSFTSALLWLLTVLLAWQPVVAQQGDYVVSLQVTESALADTDVKFFANVREGSKPIQGIQVTFLVGSISVGTCITDVTGSCQGGYRFDTAGYYIVTALAGNSSTSKGIRIVAPPTPTETITPEPSLTPLPGVTLPPGVLPTATLLLPTLNIPTSTATSASLPILATRTPGPAITVTSLPPSPTHTPIPVESLPTFDPGFTATPFVPPDTTTPIANTLGIVAILLAISAVIITIVRVKKYRELTRNRARQ